MKIASLIKWLIYSTLLVTIIAGFSFYIYLETSIDKIVAKSDMKELISMINASDPLPESFYIVQEKYYPGKFKNGVWYSIFNRINKSHLNCPCHELYIPSITFNSKNRFADLILKLEIEDHCTPRKCFEFSMEHADFGSNKRGIRKASADFFNKKLNDLSEDEILKLILILKAPSYYSPILNPERLEEGIRGIKKKHSEENP